MEETHWLTAEEVAGYEGRSKLWVWRNRESLALRLDGPSGRNGKPVPLYDANRMSQEARRRWLADRKVNVKPIPAPESDPRQKALDLVRLPDLPEMPEEKLKLVRYRMDVIRPILRTKPRTPERGEAIRTAIRVSGESQRTVYNWLTRHESGGPQALADASRRDKGQPKKMTEASLEFMASLQISGKYSATQAWERYLEEAQWRESMIGKQMGLTESLPLPARYLSRDGILSESARMQVCSRETFRVWWKEIPEPYTLLARKEKQRFGTTQVSISHRRYEDLLPMQYVHFDHRQADLFCITRDAKGKPKLIRPWITAALDMRTRRWLAWVIVETPNSSSILTVLWKLLLLHGRPRWVYFDNGQDFESQLMTDVLEGLKVGVIHAKVKNARAKVIEPCFRRVAVVERTMRGWSGHKTDARPEETERMLEEHGKWMKGQRDATPFLAMEAVSVAYDRVFEDLDHKPMVGEGMKILTPDGEQFLTPHQCWAQLAPRTTKEVISARTLALLMRERREATVRRSEIEITISGRRVIYRASKEFSDELALTKLNGKKVKLCIDPLDLGAALVEYKGKLWCVAENLALRGMKEDAFKEDEKLRRRQQRMWADIVKARGEALTAPDPLQFIGRREDLRGETPEPERPETYPLYPEHERVAAGMNGRGAPVSPAKVDVVRVEAGADSDDDRLDFFRERSPDSLGGEE